MFVYFVTFIINIIFLLIAQKSFRKGNKFLGVLFSILVITILSLLAGLRSINVGDDTKGYIQAVYNIASRQEGYYNFIDKLVINSNFEFLYATINYIVCYLKLPINYLHYILEFIPLVFIYLACYDNRDKEGKYAIYFIIFMLLFFNKSLNMCRQTISISILIYAYKYAVDKKLIKYSLFGIFAMGFHISAVMFIPTYILTQIIRDSKKEFKKIAILIVLMIFIFKYQTIFNFLVLNLKLFDIKYLYYNSNSLGINNVPLLEYGFVTFFGLLSIFLYYKLKNNLDVKNKIYIYFMIITPIIYSLGIIGNFAFRFSYYFYYYIIFVIPLYRMLMKNNVSKKIINLIIILCLFTYSYIYYDCIGYDHTTPYESTLIRK